VCDAGASAGAARASSGFIGRFIGGFIGHLLSHSGSSPGSTLVPALGSTAWVLPEYGGAEPPRRADKRGEYRMRKVWMLVAGLVAQLPSLGSAQDTTPRFSADGLTVSMQRLGINLPRPVAEQSGVRAPLEELGREPCDRAALLNLGQALRKTGYRREGAVALVKGSSLCNGNTDALRLAINIYLDISDYATTANTATDLIALEPLGDNGYFLRAVGHERGGQYKKAADDYTNAIALFADKQRISNIGYVGLARSYEKLGQFCDAAFAIEQFIAANPARNDTAPTRTLITDYAAKGNCTDTGKMDDTFPVGQSGNTIVLAVTVNGVKGRFVFDTGASFVSLKRSFAEKAKVEIDDSSTVKLNTANGIADGVRGRAKTVQLKTVKAGDVQLIIQKAKTRSGFPRAA
jgi:predicted aspartyl protease